MSRLSLRIAKFVVLLGVIAFFSFGFLGFSHTAMNGGTDSMSSGGCVMPGMAMSLCQMDPLQHIEEWQAMFTVLPNQLSELAIFTLLLLIGALVARHFLHHLFYPPLVPAPQHLYRPPERYASFNPLQELFSNGILHPKLF